VGLNVSSTVISARLENQEARWLCLQAERRGVSLNSYLIQVIREHRNELARQPQHEHD
jgi:predicted HicB family RNase H-like nuclease